MDIWVTVNQLMFHGEGTKTGLVFPIVTQLWLLLVYKDYLF